MKQSAQQSADTPTAEELRQAARLLRPLLPASTGVPLWLESLATTIDKRSPSSPGVSTFMLERFRRIDQLWLEGKSVYEIADAENLSVANTTAYISRARRSLNLCPKRARKVLARTGHGSAMPGGKLPIGLHLFARYKAEQFEAAVTETGLEVQGVGVFPSLSAAAMSAVALKCKLRRQINGWDFWRVKLKSGCECFVSNLRASPELLTELANSSTSPEQAPTLP